MTRNGGEFLIPDLKSAHELVLLADRYRFDFIKASAVEFIALNFRYEGHSKLKIFTFESEMLSTYSCIDITEKMDELQKTAELVAEFIPVEDKIEVR